MWISWYWRNRRGAYRSATVGPFAALVLLFGELLAFPFVLAVWLYYWAIMLAVWITAEILFLSVQLTMMAWLAFRGQERHYTMVTIRHRGMPPFVAVKTRR